MSLVNLHRHSMWSLLDGSGTGHQYAERAVELGQHALAITDHGTLSGCLDHAQACVDSQLMPIMGVECYFRENRLDHNNVVKIRADGKETKVPPKRYHVTLLAMNYEGWLNLQRLTSESYASGFYYRPCIDWDLLARYNSGVYCLGGCIAGRLSSHILDGDQTQVANYIARIRSIFGDRFSLEIMPHDFDDQRTLNIATLSVANDYGIPLTATGDAHYPYENWSDTQDVLLMLATAQSEKKRAELVAKNKELADTGSGEEIKIYSMKQDHPTLYLMSEEEMVTHFLNWHPAMPHHVIETAVNHSAELIKDFVPFVLDRQIKMPKITRRMISKIDNWPSEGDDEYDEYLVKETLRKWASAGLDDLEDLYPSEHWEKFPFSQYEAQVEHEFNTFDKIGSHVWRYMLMVAGEIRWARENDVVVGPGRGSAAGSLVAYLIGITDIDPIPYDLMFERFINENRKGMPDIDIDFMPGAKGRDKVKAHTGEIYNDGKHINVIDIAAYATYGPKSALRAACRVFDLDIDYQMAASYVKALDVLKPTDKLDLEQCAQKFTQIKEFKSKYPKLWLHATRIEGHPYSQSVHASGVLVKPSNIEIPTAIKKDGDSASTVTAWPDSKELLAGYGFLKIDYLVIEGLSRQHEIMRALMERENTPIDLRELPVRWNPYAVDQAVMECLKNGQTLGVWQFEGKGTIPVLKSVRPDNMHDIAAINALIRPGPRGAGMTEEYAKRKSGLHDVAYWHESVEPVLKKTYGLMIYQEQMMEIAVQLGDFNRTEADDLRKAMGKKYREGMQAVIKFLDDLGFGTKFKHNAALKVGEEAAIDIWEKKCLPFGEYSFNASHAYAYALISYHDAMFKTIAPGDFYAGYLSSAKSTDLPQKLSGSMREGDRMGIKILPPDINKSGYGFTVLDSKTILYGLEGVKGLGPTGIKAIFEERPFTSYEDFANRVPARACNKNAKLSLVGCGAFDGFGLRNLMTEQERASNEEAYIGVKLSGKSDLDKYSDLIEGTIHSEAEFDEAMHGASLCIGGEIIGIKETRTKAKGEAMAFVNFAYGMDTYRATLFPQVWAGYAGMFSVGKVVFVEGRKDVSDQYGDGFIVKECMTLEELITMRMNA